MDDNQHYLSFARGFKFGFDEAAAEANSEWLRRRIMDFLGPRIAEHDFVDSRSMQGMTESQKVAHLLGGLAKAGG